MVSTISFLLDSTGRTIMSKNKINVESTLFECNNCGKVCNRKDNLRRHVLACENINTDKVCYCLVCEKKFVNKSSCLRHLRTIHSNTSALLTCDICNKEFNRNDNFKRHKEKCKNRVVEQDLFRCAFCGKEYNKKISLKSHIFFKHLKENNIEKCVTCKAEMKTCTCDSIVKSLAEENSISCLKCALCGNSFSNRKYMLNHLMGNDHNVQISHQHFKFSSLDEFNRWKVKIEKTTTTFFRKSCGVKHSLQSMFLRFVCHRSGSYTPKTCDRKRRVKLQGTKRIGAFCPAEIILNVKKETGVCRVSYVSMHLGHNVADDSELTHLYPTKDERMEIASRISLGIPYDQILSEFAEPAKKTPYLLNRKYLDNISRAFNARNEPVDQVLENSNSALTNVESFLELHHQSILFYQKEKESDLWNLSSIVDNFTIIIMSEKQKEILRKYYHNVICFDGTFDLDNCDFLFLCLLVVDDYHEAIPVSFAITNKKGGLSVAEFLAHIKKEVGVLKPKMFMSDVRYNHYDDWQNVMGPVLQFYPFCKWYLQEALRRRLKKISYIDKKNKVSEKFFNISVQTRVDYFNRILNSADSDLNEDDEEMENWMYCCNENLETNTNMHVRSVNHCLKYFYETFNENKTLMSCLNFLNQYLKIDKLEIRGKSSYKIPEIRNRHDRLLKEDSNVFVETAPEGGWYAIVPEETNEATVLHYIQECNSDCVECKLYCEKCDACLHKYRCTCIDNSVKNNMCEHIHALCKYLKSKSDNSKTKETFVDSNEVLLTCYSVEDVIEEVEEICLNINSDNNC